MVSIKNNELRISNDGPSLYKAIADDFMQRANQCAKEHNFFNVCLSGGNTPKKLFALLSEEPYKSGIEWDKIYFFYGDERYVPGDQPDNNYFMSHQYLFNNVNVPMVHVFQIPTEYKDPSKAADDYAATIRDILKVSGNEIPQFDILYLGLGTNAHTASLMPGTDLVKAYAKSVDGSKKGQIMAAAWIEELNMNRVTMTPPIINNSKCVAFLVEGDAKAEPVWQILEGPHDPVTCPAQLIKAENGQTLWFLDKPATAKLTSI
jgi:6-phosphogluconolactonase